MKNNKGQKNTPILGELFFKSNRDLIKYIKPTWYGDAGRTGPTGALTQGDYDRVDRRINKQDQSNQKNSQNLPEYAEYLANQIQDQRQQWEGRRGRAKTGKYTLDTEQGNTPAARAAFDEQNATGPAAFANVERAQRQAESLPRVNRRFLDDRKPTAEERTEDDVWTRMANAKRDDPKDKVSVSGSKLFDSDIPNVFIDEARESLRGDNQKEAYDRLTDRVRAAQDQSAKDDAERDGKDPNARKRFDASMHPVEEQVIRRTDPKDIIQDGPLRRLNGAVNAVNNQQTSPANNQTANNQPSPPANNQQPSMDPAARARMDKIAAADAAKADNKKQYIENREPARDMGTRLSTNDSVQRNPVRKRSFTDLLLGRTSPEMQQLRDKTAARAAFDAGRVKPLSTPQQDRFAQNDAEEIARTPKPATRPSVWDAGAEGLKKLKNTVLGRSMLHVDRDTMRLNKAVNNAFRKSKKKLSKAESEYEEKYKNQDHYQVLGLQPGATAEQAQAAYKKLSMKHHPDRMGGSVDKFKSISIARDFIRNAPSPPLYSDSSTSASSGVESTPHVTETATPVNSSGDRSATVTTQPSNTVTTQSSNNPSANNPATSTTGPLHATGPVSAPQPVGATVSPGLKPGANTAKQTVAKLEPSPEIKPPTDSISIPDFRPVTQNRPASAGSQIFQGLNTFNAIMDKRRANKRFGPGASQERKYDRTGRHLADSSLLRAFQRSLSKARRDYNEMVTNNVVPQEVEGTAKEDTGYKQFTGRTLTSAGRHNARYVAPYEGLGVKREAHAMDQGSIGMHQPLTAKVVLRSAKRRRKNNQLPVQRVYTGIPKDITFSGKPGDDT